MLNNLHIYLSWLEGTVTPQDHRQYEQLTEKAKVSMCRDILEKNAKAVGIRRAQVPQMSDDEVIEWSQALFEEYGHYLRTMYEK